MVDSAAAPGTAFDDGKDDGALRTIGEVARGVGVKQHVLRYWEQQFPMLRPLKRSGNRRYYRPEDVALVEQINRLVNREGYTLRGARLALEHGEAERAPTAAPAPLPSQPTADASIIDKLKAIRSRLASALDAAA